MAVASMSNGALAQSIPISSPNRHASSAVNSCRGSDMASAHFCSASSRSARCLIPISILRSMMSEPDSIGIIPRRSQSSGSQEAARSFNRLSPIVAGDAGYDHAQQRSPSISPSNASAADRALEPASKIRLGPNGSRCRGFVERIPGTNRVVYDGSRTRSIAWITPFDAKTSVTMICASLM